MNEAVLNTVKGILHDGIDVVLLFVNKVLTRTVDLTNNESGKIAEDLKEKINKKLVSNKEDNSIKF